jgi:hypothetical protein
LFARRLAERRERQEQQARDATVNAVLARAAAEDEPPTVSQILARASQAETAYPQVPSKHVWVGSGKRGEPWALLGRADERGAGRQPHPTRSARVGNGRRVTRNNLSPRHQTRLRPAPHRGR